MRIPWSGVAAIVLAACAATPPPPTSGVREALVKQGYRPSLLHGELLYCRPEAVTGTQFPSTVCRSEGEIRQLQQDTRDTTQSHAMHPNFQCGPPECPRQ